MIEWNRCSDKLPEKKPHVYLIAHDPCDHGPRITFGFLDKDSRWCEYPAMDDLEDQHVTHWAEINLPGESPPPEIKPSAKMLAKPKTIFCDIDGTLVTHHGSLSEQMRHTDVLQGTLEKLHEWDSKGHNIILTSGRRESMRNITEFQLQRVGIFYDHLLLGLGGGQRVVINDLKPNDPSPTARAICVPRNQGIEGVVL